MRWLMAMLFVSGASYLSWSLYSRLTAEPPAEPSRWTAPPQEPVLPRSDFDRVRRSLGHRSPAVRRAAMELLHALRDPYMLDKLDRMAGEDPDPAVRRRAAVLLDEGGATAVAGLLRGLRDPQPAVRLASLEALTRVGDPATAVFIAEVAVSDAEPEVRAEALKALQSFQDKRAGEFRALAEQLKREYERTLHGDQ